MDAGSGVQKRVWRSRRANTYEELLLLRGLDGAVLREALDDGDGFVELGLGHGGGWR